MCKNLTVVFGLFGVLLLTPSLSFAQNKTFVVSASVPSATSVAINAASVNATTNAFTPVAGTSLSFNPMTFNATTGTYFPDHYFAIDVVAQGGAGSPSATITYTEGANPNSPGKGLGWKSTATFMKTTGSGVTTTDTPLAAHGPKKLLKDLTSESISSAETAGGWLRLYVGLVTKDPAATIPDPAAGEVFTNADKSGNYDGTLFISATVL